MSPIPYVAVLAAVAGLLAQPAVADGTHFRVKPITVAGGANVSANAINNNGMIAGTYGGGLNGFILSGTALTTLPPTFANCPDGCVAVPTAINAAGDVVGTTFFGDVYAFLWHNGAYVAAGSFDLGLTGDAAAGPGINRKGQEFYNYFVHGGIFIPYFGTPGAMVQIMPLGSFPVINSINDRGAAAGTFSPFAPSVFLYSGGQYVTIAPPAAISSEGGYVNNSGRVAGTYQDKQGAWHGFVYRAGKYASFDMPGTVTSITVRAINNKGRVVGTFVGGKSGLQQIFLYNGSTVSVFGKYAASDQIQIAMNDIGRMVISDYANGAFRSYRVRCFGAGC